jgi:glutathione synthase/RimK-type ligase-like ATP-grasp enzyme
VRIPSIAIFSLEHDLHARAVLHSIRSIGAAEAHLVVTDAMCTAGGLSWEMGLSPPVCELRTEENSTLRLQDVDVIWWRRVNQPQRQTSSNLASDVAHFVDNEWRAALLGSVRSTFYGVWVNDPDADLLAGNKLFQLRAALECGLTVPRTLVSQDTSRVRKFCREVGNRMIAKKILGATGMQLATVTVSHSDLLSDEQISICPAMYQELVEGTQHLRISCFGDSIHPIRITSETLDWRRDLSVPFDAFEVDEQLRAKLVALLQQLRLRMAVVDMKIDKQGVPVWIELNTQGQFLFAEALSGLDLTTPFARYLTDLAVEQSAASRRAISRGVQETSSVHCQLAH